MALATQLAAPISDTDMSFTLADTSTWLESSTSFGTLGAELGTSGNFVVTLDYGTTNAEKILCSAMSAAGTAATFTVVQRNYDATAPTVAKNHGTGAVAVHTFDSSTAYLSTIAPTAEADAQTALTNAATAQTTANAAQTTANGPQLTSTPTFFPLSGTPSANPIQTYSWSETFHITNGFGTAAVTYPIPFAHAVMGVTATVCNIQGLSPTARYCLIDYTGSNSLSGTVIYLYGVGGGPVTNGDYRVNFTVSGY